MNNEEQLAKELGRFFNRLKKEVLAALEEYWRDYHMLQGHINLICSPVHEAHREYYEILEKYVKREYKLGQAEAKRAVDRLNKKHRFAFKEIRTMPLAGFIKRDNDLFATSPKAEQDLLNRTFRASERTMQRVDGQINAIITDGYKSGKGINDIGNKLTRRFDQLATWESRRIARTEVNTSHNVATVNTYQDMGVEYTQWIAANDDRTRDSHAEIDGEIIPLGGKYSNGLEYPGDMSGPIEEWINCRCSNAPFVIPYGYLAPSFSPFREDDLVPIETKPLDLTPTVEQPVSEPQIENNFFKGDPTISELTDYRTGKVMDVYEFENIKVAFDRGETALTLEEVTAHINSLPKVFRETNARIIKIHDFSNADGSAGTYTKLGSELRLYKPKGYSKQEILDTFTHELAHSIDSNRGAGYKYSSIEKYEAIFKADNKLYRVLNERTGRYRTPKKFPTTYAGRSYAKFKKSKTKKNMIYVEDFAEASKEYLNPLRHEEFVKNFPNRAKYLEEIYGKPKWEENSPLMKAIAKEGDMKQIRENRVKEYQENKQKAYEQQKEQNKRFEELSKTELDKHLKEVLSSDTHVQAYYGMVEELKTIQAIQDTIMMGDPKPLMDRGYSREKAMQVIENPNYYLNKNREKKNKYQAVISEVENLVKQRLM